LGASRRVDIYPVWKKSPREHQIIRSTPAQIRAEADAAAKMLGWNGPYFVDADHVTQKTVDRFIAASDFFTLDVGEWVGCPANPEAEESFLRLARKSLGAIEIPELSEALYLTDQNLGVTTRNFLRPIEEAVRSTSTLRKQKKTSWRRFLWMRSNKRRARLCFLDSDDDCCHGYSGPDDCP
jgi:hypothetical protein